MRNKIRFCRPSKRIVNKQKALKTLPEARDQAVLQIDLLYTKESNLLPTSAEVQTAFQNNNKIHLVEISTKMEKPYLVDAMDAPSL